MLQPGWIFAPRRLRAGLALAGALVGIALSAGGGAGCTVLLETDIAPYKCETDADCAKYSNAACDSARKQCVPRLPFAGVDAGAPPPDAGDDGGGVLACELSFDNRRIPFEGDGGLRPLPEVP